jgi:hypothetical protein
MSGLFDLDAFSDFVSTVINYKVPLACCSLPHGSIIANRIILHIRNTRATAAPRLGDIGRLGCTFRMVSLGMKLKGSAEECAFSYFVPVYFQSSLLVSEIVIKACQSLDHETYATNTAASPKDGKARTTRQWRRWTIPFDHQSESALLPHATELSDGEQTDGGLGKE